MQALQALSWRRRCRCRCWCWLLEIPCDTFVGQVRIGGLPSGSCSTCRTSHCCQVVCLQLGPWDSHKLAQPLYLNSVVVGMQGAFCVIVFAPKLDPWAWVPWFLGTWVPFLHSIEIKSFGTTASPKMQHAQTLNYPKPQTPNPKPQTPSPKPQTLSPKPQSLNPKP